MKTLLLFFALVASAHAADRKVLVTESLVDINNRYGEGQTPLHTGKAPKVYRLRATYEFAVHQESTAVIKHLPDQEACHWSCTIIPAHTEATLDLSSGEIGILRWELFDQDTGALVGRHEEPFGYQPTLSRNSAPGLPVSFAGTERMPSPDRRFSDKPQLPGVDFQLPGGHHLYFAWAFDESLFEKGKVKISSLGGDRYRLDDIQLNLKREYLNVGAFYSPEAAGENGINEETFYVGGPGMKMPSMQSKVIRFAPAN